MEYIIKFVYGFILPPGLFVTLLVILSIRIRRHRPVAIITGSLAVLLYLSYIPITGDLLLHPLENAYQPPSHPSGDVIVMLGGGATPDTPDINGKGQLSGDAANRLLTTFRLYKLTGLPIILSGGKVFPDSGIEADIAKRQLIALGVPGNKIMTENKSITTTQNARNTKAVMRTHRLNRPILVTSAFHMRRAVMNFNKTGVQVQPYPTDYLTSRRLSVYPMQFVPSEGSATSTAVKEYIGILALYF
ncbi:YdcF family protein [Sporolactobacillus sp. CQH2019]|uniref:YdcF family protein n=1 Tax=Sporolactobacillus sp. CQH2019 TaxID=3023512 RepID=UPI002367F0A1|nr:YdcF family protein [Sporolactobacillus sp. CQH2019]MDD9147963.1 YdcF family protein [Sporolactobacillus sp. CQH2019]